MSTTAGEDSPTPPHSFEQALAELEAIVAELEEGQIRRWPRAWRVTRRAFDCSKQCYQLLERAERRIELLNRVDPDGNAQSPSHLTIGRFRLEEKAQARGPTPFSDAGKNRSRRPQTR